MKRSVMQDDTATVINLLSSNFASDVQHTRIRLLNVARTSHHYFRTASVAWNDNSMIVFGNTIVPWLPTNLSLRVTLGEIGVFLSRGNMRCPARSAHVQQRQHQHHHHEQQSLRPRITYLFWNVMVLLVVIALLIFLN